MSSLADGAASCGSATKLLTNRNASSNTSNNHTNTTNNNKHSNSNDNNKIIMVIMIIIWRVRDKAGGLPRLLSLSLLLLLLRRCYYQ